MSLTIHPFNSAAQHVRRTLSATHFGDSKFLGMSVLATALSPWNWAGPLAASLFVAQYSRETYYVRRPLMQSLQDVQQDKKRWGIVVRISELAILVETVVAALMLTPSMWQGGSITEQSALGKSLMILAPTQLLAHVGLSTYYLDTVDERCGDILDRYNSSWLTKLTFAGVQG